MKSIKLLIGVSATIYIAVFAAVKLFRFPARLIAKENSPVETISALLFAVVFATAIYLFMSKQSLHKRHRMWLAGLAGMGLLGFLEEISFGGNYITLPEWRVGEVKIDGFHDIGILIYAALQRIHTPVTAVIITLFLGLLIVASLTILMRKRQQIYPIVPHPQDYPLYFFLGVFMGLIGLAMFIDLEIFRHPILSLLEELFELNASFPLIFATLYIGSLNTSDAKLPVLVNVKGVRR